MVHLHEFIVVVEQKSLNRASRLLNISQPALSRKIKALENELGVELFERRGKRLALTRAGEICYEYAVEMKGLETKLLQAMRRFQPNQPPRRLTIGASLTTLQSTLPDIITNFLQEFPETDIQAMTGKTQEVVTMVIEKKVDIGLVASHVDRAGLVCLPLFNDNLRLVLPADHPLANKRQLSMHDLNDLPMILFSKGTWYRILMDELFHRYAVFPDVKMEIDSFEAIIRLVSTCKTATLLPRSYLSEHLLETNRLTMVDISELEATVRTTSLICREDVRDHDPIRLFMEKAKETYGSSK